MTEVCSHAKSSRKLVHHVAEFFFQRSPYKDDLGKRDSFVNQALKAANLNILHIKTDYNLQEFKGKIDEQLLKKALP